MQIQLEEQELDAVQSQNGSIEHLAENQWLKMFQFSYDRFLCIQKVCPSVLLIIEKAFFS